MVTGFGDVYADGRQRVSELALSLSEDELSSSVPACPAWSVKDLIAHLCGITADMLTGNVAEVGEEQWTAAQIEARRDKGIAEIVEEWASNCAQVEPALDLVHPKAAALTIGDLVTHEHDARGAVARPGGRDSAGMEIALDGYVRTLGRRIKDSDLPPLRVRAGEREWVAGAGEPTESVEGDPFELLRALTGRRTKDEVRGLRWSGNPEPYLGVFSMYAWPASSLQE